MQFARMASASSATSRSFPSPPTGGVLATVRLEVRQGASRSTLHEVAAASFLIGSVPGCDLRLSGTHLPPVYCVLTRHSDGVDLRKLAPIQPLLVNGHPVQTTRLADGDRVLLGAVELLVHVQEAHRSQNEFESSAEARTGTGRKPALSDDGTLSRTLQELEERARELDAREKLLVQQTQELETDRIIWYRRREQIEKECLQQQTAASTTLQESQQWERDLNTALAELEEREQGLQHEREELALQQAELAERSTAAVRQQAELDSARQELADIRQKLYDRYRERRDRLAGLHESIRRAATKIQERKRLLDLDAQTHETRLQELATSRVEIETRTAELEQEQRRLTEQQHQFSHRQHELEHDLSERLAECQALEQRLAKEQQALEQGQAEHQADLVRLDRLQAALDQREKHLRQRALEIDHRFEQLQRDTRELEEQAAHLDEWHAQLTAEAERLTQQKSEQDNAASDLAQRTAGLEGQQAMLTSLRTRLERMREELRHDEAQLVTARERHEAAELELHERLQETKRQQAELDLERQLHEQERHQFEERRSVLEAAVTQLRQTQEALATHEAQLKEREQALNTAAAEQAEQFGLMRARAEQLAELQQRLTADRQSLRDREVTLTQSEQAVTALQEQLRRRSEDLAAQQRAIVEQAEQYRQAVAELESRRTDLEQERQRLHEELSAVHQKLDGGAMELERLRTELNKREETLQRNIERLKVAGRNIAAERKTIATERTQWQMDQRTASESLAQGRQESEAVRQEILDLQRQLPDLEGRAQAATERLDQVREQLREHLAEIHNYARQSREDLESLRAQVQADAERIRVQEHSLHQARDEQRLTITAFRQQLIDWQARVAEMKRSLLEGETRLERRQAEVDEQARQIDETAARLARQAEQVQEQERLVTERRDEVERHLSDMREWYRRKLRELAGIHAPVAESGTEGAESFPLLLPAPPIIGVTSPEAENAPLSGEVAASTGDASPAEHDILTLTEEVDPGDRQLGDLLRSLELVDADTLTALLIEARRQRRSLRQMLLAGGYLTLYQMAMIEAGNLDGLVLGPLRLIDRLRATARETIYRVFDPRRDQEAVLRHLAEAEMQDAVHPDEFRQRFAAAAAVHHAHLAATFEVLDISGRPAVLQEWLVGLPSTDWPPLAAVPGVWFRLISQAALGLQAAHQAGLVHGHLDPNQIVITADGTLKLCGFGEPSWLAMPPATVEAEGNDVTDLIALGRIAASWANTAGLRKGAKVKPMPPSLEAVVQRLLSEDESQRYPTATSLVEELEQIRNDVPPNAAAWERFLRHIREQAVDTALKMSA